MPREPLTRNLIPPPGFKVQKADPRLYHLNRQGAWKEGKWGGGGGSARKTMRRVSDDEQPANMVPVVRGPRSGLWKGLGSGKAVPKAIAIPWAIGKRIPNLLSHFPRSCEMGKFLFAVEMSN